MQSRAEEIANAPDATTASARVIELPGGKKMSAADDSDGGPKSASHGRERERERRERELKEGKEAIAREIAERNRRAGWPH
jgi:hypothetical protein